MQLVVILILSLVLALPDAPYPLLRGPVAVAGTLLFVTLLPAAFGLWVARRTLRALEAHPENPEPAQDWLSWGVTAVHALLAAGHGAALLGTVWIDLCMRALPLALPTAGGMLVALPFLVSVLLAWMALYPADRAVRQIALETHLFRARPVRPVWSMGEYLLFNFRHQVLFILIPMWVVLLVRDLLERFSDPIRRLAGHPFAPDMLLGASALLVAALTPIVMRYVWSLRPLPAGPLRERLVELCRALRIRFRDILVWHSGGLVVNAAVVGILPRWRYVMFSDGLLEQLDDLKIEGVFGHELGHIKRHHIPYFLAFGFISGCIVAILGTWADRSDRTAWLLIGVLGAAVLLFKWGVVFGWISRRFERQADVFGVRALALAGVPCTHACALHRPEAFLATTPAARHAPAAASGTPASPAIGPVACASAVSGAAPGTPASSMGPAQGAAPSGLTPVDAQSLPASPPPDDATPGSNQSQLAPSQPPPASIQPPPASSHSPPAPSRTPSAAGELVPAPLGLALASAGARRAAADARRSGPGDPLCIAAAACFGQTLLDVASLNGIPAEAPSFRHSSIASRARFVDELARDPAATAAFERSVAWAKCGILLAAALSALLAVWVLKLWTIVLR